MISIKLSKWAKDNGFTYQGAYELFCRGQLANAYKLPSGTILVKVDDTSKDQEKQEKIVIYARVSTPKQKDDLVRQVERLEQFCASKGYIVEKTYKEIASGLNDNRKKLNNILNDKSITKIVVENKDRLTRFGFNYIETLLTSEGREIVVINKNEAKDADLIQDFVSIITSMAARVYGNRRSKNKTKEILGIVKSDGPKNLTF